jgi:Cu+-exporting ATPase
MVVIGPDEEAVVERFGNPLDGNQQPRYMDPGLALKWPWPIDIVQRYPTQRIKQLYIGYVPETDEDGNIKRGPLLWGKTHYQEEHDVLVASEQRSDDNTEEALPVSLVKANLPVQYRVKDIYAYLYNHTDPDTLLEAICYHELARYAASAKIEVDTASTQDLRESLLGAGRSLAGVVLKERIQTAADEADLGVEVLFLGLQGIHPPPEVAENYHAVVGAVQERQTKILEAHAQRNISLSSVAGSVDNAVSLYALAEQFQQARESGDMSRLPDLVEQLDTAFTEAEGAIFETLRRAQAEAYVAPTLARADGLRFQGQVEAFHASADIYKRQQRLLAMQEALASIRKYVLFSDPEDAEVLLIDLHEKLALGLSDIGVFGDDEEL